MAEIELPEPLEGKNDRFYGVIAVSVALLSAFLAITKVKSDNINQAMVQSKADAVDTWNEYQAKKLKLYLYEATVVQSRAIRSVVPGPAGEQLDRDMQAYVTDIERYKTEVPALMKKAKDFEAKGEELNFTDDQFDLTEAFLSITLALMAVAALTKKRWLLLGALAPASFGVVMGLSGLLGWGIHPDFLTKLLS